MCCTWRIAYIKVEVKYEKRSNRWLIRGWFDGFKLLYRSKGPGAMVPSTRHAIDQEKEQEEEKEKYGSWEKEASLRGLECGGPNERASFTHPRPHLQQWKHELGVRIHAARQEGHQPGCHGGMGGEFIPSLSWREYMTMVVVRCDWDLLSEYSCSI